MIPTKEKILGLIKQNQGLAAKDIIAHFGLTRAMIFRHLQDLLKDGQIIKIGKAPKVKYFYKYSMGKKTNLEQRFFDWAMTGKMWNGGKDFICFSRDIFRGREEKLLMILKESVNENLLYLLIGAAGEIGNNSFDHNLGNWRDAPGILLATDLRAREIILADRGQGVLFTIRRVRPKTANDGEALRAAFTEIISGRYPEHRGNGLKFVKKIMQENNLYFEFYSGEAVVKISKNIFSIEKSDFQIPGTLAIIKF